MLQRAWNIFRRDDDDALTTGGGPEHPTTSQVIELNEWYDRLVASASSHGRMPYVVDGFQEVWDAVRRGHAVVLRRAPAEVADGISVFDGPPAASLPGGPGDAIAERTSANGREVPQLVTIRRFDMGRARFEIHDPHGTIGDVRMTPKRLQRYLEAPERRLGVALGA